MFCICVCVLWRFARAVTVVYVYVSMWYSFERVAGVVCVDEPPLKSTKRENCFCGLRTVAPNQKPQPETQNTSQTLSKIRKKSVQSKYLNSPLSAETPKASWQIAPSQPIRAIGVVSPRTLALGVGAQVSDRQQNNKLAPKNTTNNGFGSIDWIRVCSQVLCVVCVSYVGALRRRNKRRAASGGRATWQIVAGGCAVCQTRLGECAENSFVFVNCDARDVVLTLLTQVYAAYTDGCVRVWSNGEWKGSYRGHKATVLCLEIVGLVLPLWFWILFVDFISISQRFFVCLFVLLFLLTCEISREMFTGSADQVGFFFFFFFFFFFCLFIFLSNPKNLNNKFIYFFYLSFVIFAFFSK